MNKLEEIRQKYPDYAGVSDEQILKGLHAKFYSNMDFADFQAKMTGGTSSPSSPAAEIADAPAPEAEAPAPQEGGFFDRARSAYARVKAGDPNARAAAIEGFAHDGTFGFKDELQAGIGTALDKLSGNPTDYTTLRDQYRKEHEATLAKDPDAGLIGTAGSFLAPGKFLAKGIKAGTGLIKTGATVGARAGGLYGLGASEADNAADMAIDAGEGAVTGAVIGGVASPVIAPVARVLAGAKEKVAGKVSNNKWKLPEGTPENLVKEFESRVADYAARNPEVTKTGLKANDVVNSMFRDLGVEFDLVVKKANARKPLSEGERVLLNDLKARVSGKTKVFSKSDEEAAQRLLGDDWNEVNRMMHLSDFMSENVGSMKEIIGPLAYAMESRNASGNFGTLMETIGLKKLSRGWFQRRNPVAKAGEAGNRADFPSAKARLQQELDELVAQNKASKEALRAAPREQAQSAKAERKAAEAALNRQVHDALPDSPDRVPTGGWQFTARTRVNKNLKISERNLPIEEQNRLFRQVTEDTLAKLPEDIRYQVQAALNTNMEDFAQGSVPWRFMATVSDEYGRVARAAQAEAVAAREAAEAEKLVERAAKARAGKEARAKARAEGRAAKVAPEAPGTPAVNPDGSPILDAAGQPIRSLEAYSGAVARNRALNAIGVETRPARPVAPEAPPATPVAPPPPVEPVAPPAAPQVPPAAQVQPVPPAAPDPVVTRARKKLTLKGLRPQGATAEATGQTGSKGAREGAKQALSRFTPEELEAASLANGVDGPAADVLRYVESRTENLRFAPGAEMDNYLAAEDKLKERIVRLLQNPTEKNLELAHKMANEHIVKFRNK